MFLHQTIVLAIQKHLQYVVDALSKIDDAFLTKKAENFILFKLSDNVQILLACGINTYYGITNGISDFRCQHL